MASRRENLKSLFTNSRTRIIILFTAVLLIITVAIGIIRLQRTERPGPAATAEVTTTPAGIRSIPGALDPTVQYAKLQEQQNIAQAQLAEKTGGSAVPTIIRTQAIGEGVGAIGAQDGKGGVGFETLARESEAGAQKSLWIQDLQQNNCDKQTMTRVVNEGAQLSDLKQACTCTQLKDNGYALQDLQEVCSCKELKAAGFNARQLKDAGYTAGRLRLCGFDACELRNAGFTAQQLKDGGFTDGELRGAGYPQNEIDAASGLPEGITAADIRNAGCSANALRRLRQAGVSAAAIRRISGCSAAQLKAAGYTAKDLADAGFSAADLRKAGFTPSELKAAGFSARDLLNAGFTPDELADAGYTPAEIRAAESELPPGITSADIKNAGCDVDTLRKERLAGVSAKLIRQYAGCSAKALKAAGFTDGDLANAGFTPEQIKAAGPVSDSAIRAAGCDVDKLRQLREEGVSAKRIRELNGCTAEALKAAGYGPQSLADAGFTPQQLLDAGFTPNQLREAGLKPSGVLAEGRQQDCSVESLRKAREAGISALTIKQTLGCSAKALKDAGYTAKELKDAGFTAAELKNAGFTASQLKNAGFTPKELADAGFTAQELKDAGFTAAELKNAGFSAKALKDAGFTAAQLKAAGFSAKDLKDAGFTAAQLKAAGFSAEDLKDAGFTAQQLKNAGFSAGDLRNAGFTAAQLKDAGFSDSELRDAGFTLPGTEVAGLEGVQQPGQPSALTAVPTPPGQTTGVTADQRRLQAILQRQTDQMAEQRYQQRIQQRSNAMLSAANESLQDWKKVSTQQYTAGQPPQEKQAGPGGATIVSGAAGSTQVTTTAGSGANVQQNAVVKAGEIFYAVLDTSINSDEPGPILATVVTGKLKGSKLIGSFNLPSNSDKLIISFNTLSSPGAPKTISISAYAIDPNTARTALATRADHHYLLRYGSLFASSFLEGFGNAFQSADTKVTIGGTGGGDNITIQNGIGRSALENAVIGLATVGKTWGQQAQQLFSRPTTVEICSGTGIGVLFTQDLTSLT